MAQLDGNDLGDLPESNLSTSKIMLAAGQVRGEPTEVELAVVDALRKKKLRNWVGLTKAQVLLALFALVHATIFTHGLLYYHLDDDFASARSKLGIGFPIASAAGLVLHFDLAILIFPVCRNLTSIIRRRLLNNIIDLDDAVSLHKLASWSLVSFACIHSVAYWYSLARRAIQSNKGFLGFLTANFTTGPGVSGHLMLLLLLIIVVTSLETSRRWNLEAFWSTHQLFLWFLLLWSVHGAFCLIRSDRTSSCTSMGAFWQYLCCGGATYLGETILRQWYSRHGTPISKVIQHPGNVVEMQLTKRKTKCKVGQYIYLCVPEVSASQDFRYYLSSAPEEDYMSLHVIAANKWAQSMAASVGCVFEQRSDSAVIGIDEKAMPVGANLGIRKFLPPTFIDGPYGGFSKDIFQYEVAVLIAEECHVAPFASLLKSIWYRMSGPHEETRLRKVYLFWSYNRQAYVASEWFRSLLKAIELQDIDHNIEIYTYLYDNPRSPESMENALGSDGLTEEKLNGLRVPTKLGRPDWSTIFDALQEAHGSGKNICVSHSPGFQSLTCDVF